VDGLGLGKAHIIGLSMGGFATVHFGLEHPTKALSLVVAGAGYGAEKQHEAYFKGVSEEVARQFLAQGSKTFAETYALGASRLQLQNKDPLGWRQFADQLGEHSAVGAANTMRGVQARRPSLYDLKERLCRMPVPTLIVCGDEDDHCLQPALYMKRVIPAAGLMVLAKTGHTINLEEPAAFNGAVAEFLAMVEAGKWSVRDPRSDPAQVMRTD
jgi:pimeloyl-ACP methyl ester carboxylesterase